MCAVRTSRGPSGRRASRSTGRARQSRRVPARPRHPALDAPRRHGPHPRGRPGRQLAARDRPHSSPRLRLRCARCGCLPVCPSPTQFSILRPSEPPRHCRPRLGQAQIPTRSASSRHEPIPDPVRGLKSRVLVQMLVLTGDAYRCERGTKRAPTLPFHSLPPSTVCGRISSR